MDKSVIKKYAKFLPDRDRVRLLKLSDIHKPSDSDIEEMEALTTRAMSRAETVEAREAKASMRGAT